MCGLVGAVGVNTQNVNVFHTLLLLDVIRGKDSTGVLSVKSDASWAVRKCVGHPLNMIEGKKYREKICDNHPFLLMGHNRAATKGVVNLENAHPFVHGNIILAHNGTLWAYRDLVNYDPDIQFDTDSEHVAYAVNKNGIDEVWKELSGAAALSWWDMRDRHFRLVTNGQRPLSFVYEHLDKSVYWASEAWMLEIALAKANIKHLDIIECVPHRLYEFGWNVERKTMVHVERMLEKKSFLAPRHGHWSGYGQGGNNFYNQKPAASAPATRVSSPSSKSAFHLDHQTGEVFIIVEGRKVVTPNVPLAWLSIKDQATVREKFLGVKEPEEQVEEETEEDEVAELLKEYPECSWCTTSFDRETIMESLIRKGSGALCISCADHNPDLRMMML